MATARESSSPRSVTAAEPTRREVLVVRIRRAAEDLARRAHTGDRPTDAEFEAASAGLDVVLRQPDLAAGTLRAVRATRDELARARHPAPRETGRRKASQRWRWNRAESSATAEWRPEQQLRAPRTSNKGRGFAVRSVHEVPGGLPGLGRHRPA